MIPLHDDNPARQRAWMTLAIIIACCAVYFLVQPVGRQMVGRTTDAGTSSSCADLKFNLDHAAIPYEVTHARSFTTGSRAQYLTQVGCRRTAQTPLPTKNVWESVVVSIFLHGGLLHLGGNMLFLWIFGNNIEDRLGRARYLVFYLGAGVVATAVQVVLSPSSTAPVIGASGAIAGVMGAYLVLFPRVRIKSLIILVVIPLIFSLRAFWWLGIWFVSQFFVSPSSGVAWGAHVGGFVFGLLVGAVLRSGPASRAAERRRS